MNKLLLTLSFLISSTCFISQSWALPPCPSSGYFHNCYGSFKWKSGSVYEGDFINNKRHGHGTYIYGEGTEWRGDKYIGEYKDGKKNGHGTYTFSDGDKYIGEFKDNKKHGLGTYFYGLKSKWAGDKYIGKYKNDVMHGQGTYMFRSGAKDLGEFKNGKLNGFAIRYGANGNTLKEGIWKNDKFLYSKKKYLPI